MKIFFIFIFLLSFIISNDNKVAFAQIKIEEGFEGIEFPPQGWSTLDIQGTTGKWSGSSRITMSGNKCAVSGFSSASSNNFLVSKRITPTPGDSLVFYFRQTFWNDYKDTFNVYVSVIDSISFPASSRVLHFADNLSYPVPFGYGRYAVSMNSFAGRPVWIGFQHLNIDGENIRLDDITVGPGSVSEIGIVSNVFPSGEIDLCSSSNCVPQAIIKNFGTRSQITPFNITYSVTGPENYISVRQDTLTAGYSKTIFFDTLELLQGGKYKVRIFTSLSGDPNPLNDTLRGEYELVNNNFGGGLFMNGNYFFSNSSSCNTLLYQPEFCWKDTIGSRSLLLNGQDMSGGLMTGSINDGYFSIGGLLPAGHKFRFFDSEYDSVFISTNGIISFKQHDHLLNSNPSINNFLNLQQVPLFAPLWLDLDFGNQFVNTNRLSYKSAGNQLIITFDRAPLSSGESSDYVSFQICIEFGNNLANNSKLLVQFDQSSTGGNFMTKYFSNTLPPHLAGIKNTSGSEYILYRCNDMDEPAVNGPLFESSLALAFGPDSTKLNSRCSELFVSALLEAVTPRVDTVSVLLRDGIAPYKIIESGKIALDSIGRGHCKFTIPDESHQYYIVLNHRNSLETWSRAGGENFHSHNLNYDFSIDSSMAYGNNQIMKEGRAYIYCGDVNKDGMIDGSDMLSIFNGVNNFYRGYVNQDLNNDRIVDLEDLVFSFNNTSNFILRSSPE